MPENANQPAGAPVDSAPAPGPPPSCGPGTSQASLDKIVQTRLARERNKYTDYEDLKAKAAKFDEIVEANKTELEKAVERAEAAETQLREATALSEKLGILAEFQIPTDYQELLTATDPEGLRAQASKIQDLLKPRGAVIPNEGKQPSGRVGSGDPLRDAFHRL